MEMNHFSFKLKYWRFSDAVGALDQLGCCDEVYVEKASIKESFRNDKTTGLREKYFLLSVTVRSRLDSLEDRGLMKHVKATAIRD